MNKNTKKLIDLVKTRKTQNVVYDHKTFKKYYKSSDESDDYNDYN